MSATTQTTVPSTEANAKPLEGEALHDALKKQLEYYFSKENLMTDKYLLSQMNAEMYVPIKTIENFKMVKTLTEDAELIVKTLRELPSVVVDENGSMVKPNIKAHRNTIILRDIPSSTPVEEIKKLFENDSCGKVVDIKSEIGDNWYIQLDDDDSSLPTLEYIRNQKFNDKPVQARIKTENTFRSLYASAITSAAQTGQNVQVSYGYKPVQPQDVNAQQYENDNNYGRGNYNNRGGYRKRGGYNNRGNNRGGYKGHNNNNRENNQNAQNTNNGQTRKRRDSGKELKLSSDHFPPLPSQDKKVSGYTEEFRKYSRQEIVDVLTSIKEVQKPIISDIGITLEQPLLTLEASKPWPVVKKETKEETETTTKDESSSQTVESNKIATTDNQTQAVETKSS